MNFFAPRYWLAMGCLALSAGAQGDNVKLATGNYPPYEFSENGRVQGLAVDLLREAFQRSHHTLEIVLLPWARALVEGQAGHVDGVFCTIATPERQASFDFGREALVGMRTSLFVVQGAPIAFKGKLDAMAPYRFGVMNQAANGPQFDAAITQGRLTKVQPVQDVDTNVKKLLAGRIDIMVSDHFVAMNYLRKNELQAQVTELTPSIFESPCFVAWTRTRKLARLRTGLDAALASMKADGTYRRIVAQYEGGPR